MGDRLDGYVRVSKVAGREGDSFISTRVQRDKIEAWAKLHDGQLGQVVEELDVSGGSAPEERKLEALLRRCESGASQGIVTWRIDRFSRSAVDTLAAVKRLAACGARLVGVDDGVDSTAPGGKLVLTVMAGLAESQLDQTRESWRTARREASKRGLYLSGHPPTGYVRSVLREKRDGSPEYGPLVPDPAAAPAIREAFRLRAAGGSFQAVADLLSESGVLPRAGLRKDGVERTRWGREGARGLIRNSVYKGVPAGANSGVDVEGIVTSDEWARAQVPTRAYPTGSGRTRALLLGLAVCGGCGHALHATGRGPSYSCRGKFASGLCPARAVASCTRVDDYVIRAVERRAEEETESPPSSESLWLAAREAVEAAEAELDTWIADATLRERLGEGRFNRGLDARVTRLEEAQRELYALPDPGIPDDALVVNLSGVPAVYWAFGQDIDADRKWIRGIVSRVVVHRADPARRKHQPISERVEVIWR